MGSFTVGSIVLVKFPFSDLSDFKLRPAIIFLNDSNNDHILCQITSREYSDKNAIKIKPADCSEGSLEKISFIRPLKIFTANESIFSKKICNINSNILASLRKSIIDLIELSDIK